MYGSPFVPDQAAELSRPKVPVLTGSHLSENIAVPLAHNLPENIASGSTVVSCGADWIGLYIRPVRQMQAVSRSVTVTRPNSSNVGSRCRAHNLPENIAPAGTRSGPFGAQVATGPYRRSNCVYTRPMLVS